jgi:hypothetical protein
MDRIREGPSSPGLARPADTGEAEVTRTFAGAPPHPPTEVAAPRLPTELVAPQLPAEIVAPWQEEKAVLAPSASTDVVRYGPGVPVTPPADQAGLTAERVWRTGRPPEPPRHPARLRRLAGSALTVILLAASGMGIYLRFHHAPFHVTNAAITQQTRTGCGVDVTGRIITNGSAGAVSYQWLFQPSGQPPQPLSQSVAAGQRAVYVTVAVQGSGRGSASQTVTLQVLGPDLRTASTAVTVSC